MANSNYIKFSNLKLHDKLFIKDDKYIIKNITNYVSASDSKDYFFEFELPQWA